MTLWTLAPSSVEIWGEGALTGTKKKESCGLASLREVAFSEESSQLKASSQGGSQGNQHPDLHPSLCRLQRKPVAEAQWVPVLDVLLASSQLLKHLRFTHSLWYWALSRAEQSGGECIERSQHKVSSTGFRFFFLHDLCYEVHCDQNTPYLSCLSSSHSPIKWG